MIETKKPGRPQLPKEKRLEARYNVKVNARMYNDLERVSHALNESPHQIIRRAIDIYLNSTQLSFDFYGDVAFLKELKSHNEKTALKDFKAMLSVEEILSRYGGLKGFEKLLLEAGYHRTTVFRESRNMHELLNKRSFFLKF